MADKLTEFVTAKNAFFDKLAAIRPQLKALEDEQLQVEEMGRAAKLTISGIKESVPNFSFKISWPEGLEPPAAAVEG